MSAENDQLRQQLIAQVKKAIAHVIAKKGLPSVFCSLIYAVFHVPLKELMASKREEGRAVPAIVDSAICYLRETSTNVVIPQVKTLAHDIEGLFRVSGDSSEIDTLEAKIEEDGMKTLLLFLTKQRKNRHSKGKTLMLYLEY